MLLEVKGLRKAYKQKHLPPLLAVKDVSIEVQQGEILGFLGPNGAGKTTTIKMIAGLVRPDDGEIRIDGQLLHAAHSRAVSQIGAVLEGSRNLYWRLSPLENLVYFAGLRGIKKRAATERARYLLGEFGMLDKVNTIVQKLSRGQQQKVAVCAALMHQPKLLLLDEPTLGLDLEASDKIQSLVLQMAHEEGISIVLTTHQMEIAQALSDTVAIIQEGRIVLSGEKTSILSRFQKPWYVIQVGEPFESIHIHQLTTRGGTVVDETEARVPVHSAKELYALFEVLRPLPITKIEQEKADLATVFRYYTSTGGHEDDTTHAL